MFKMRKYLLFSVFVFLVSIAFTGVESNQHMSVFQWKTNSVLKSGKWLKIKTTKKGIYKITVDKLKTWGFTSPELVNVYGSGGYKLSESLADEPLDDLVKNRSWRGKDNAGKDCLYFFSTGTVAWKWDVSSGIFRHTINPYSADCFYFLSQEGNSASDVEVSTVPAQAASQTVTSFDDYKVYETEQYNLIESGQQWFGEKFIRNTSRTLGLTCENPVPGATSFLLINAAGRSSSSSSFEVTFNQSKLTGINFTPVNLENATGQYAEESQQLYPVNSNSQTQELNLVYNATNSLSEAWLDYFTVNWRRQLKMSGDELYFRDTKSTGSGKTVQFTLENGTGGIKVYDVTNPSSITEVPCTEQGTSLIFKRTANELREYVAFKATADFPEPSLIGEVPNQNLHALAVPDLLIISHPDYLVQANKVAEFHQQKDKMSVEVITVNQVFNEFGSGSPDATAIRNVIKMFYDRSRKIKYVLFYGDGSYDNRNITGANKALIPTFQSENSLTPTSSFVSDDYFVILDQGESVYNGLMDLGIGRLPVSSVYEAQVVAGKIMNYYSPASMGIWRTNLCFIADDQDGNLHMGDSEALSDQVNTDHREFQTDKIYFDAYPQIATPAGERYPGVVDALNNRVKEGVLILNYVGHANERYLADERVLDVSAINSWTNINNLPIFVTATCEFSRFDSNETSAGEYILLNPNGGGIGLFSTTRVVFAYSNFLLSKNFYKYAFEKDAEGLNYRMGDIMRLAKINTLNTLNIRNFTLLADPALRLSYPKYKVVTKTVNQKPALLVTDTLRALNKVNITGEITNHFGVKLTSFTGKITAVVYDKATVQKTLGNAGETPFYYKVQENVIYQGDATVSNGEFSFSFVVPKDISYNYDKGKILYYAQNGEDDAHGAFENFIIGGSSASQLADNKGPAVNLFLNDNTFQNGDETSQNPMMLAEVSDENGINTVGTGIGHDITATMDNDNASVIILNEYYKAAKDDYTKGTIAYPLRGLSIGEHTLKLKVWDIANNSTEVLINFRVTGDFYIESIHNYPNPVSQFTDFSFVHNQPDATFKALIEIFDMAGNRVDVYQTSISSKGTSSSPIRWVMTERGISLRSGVYPYRITIRSTDGKLASKSGKMLISR
jgi:hypothetical protein